MRFCLNLAHWLEALQLTLTNKVTLYICAPTTPPADNASRILVFLHLPAAVIDLYLRWRRRCMPHVTPLRVSRPCFNFESLAHIPPPEKA